MKILLFLVHFILSLYHQPHVICWQIGDNRYNCSVYWGKTPSSQKEGDRWDVSSSK